MDEKQVNPFEKAGYGQGNIGFGEKAAFLIVDFQKAFTSNEFPLGGSSLITSAVTNTQKLLPAIRESFIPVIYTVVGYRDDRQDMGLWPKKVKSLSDVRLDSEWTNISDGLDVREADIVLTKKMPSAFFNTDLTNILISKNVDTVIIAGCTTSGCIRATAVDAFSYGFRAIIAEDCVGDQGINSHRANLFDIGNRYGDILKNEDIIKYIRK